MVFKRPWFGALYPGLKNSSVAVGKPIARHTLMLLNGVPGTAMQGFKDQLSDEEIAAIVTYERNAWDNNTDDLVQPADVAQLRQTQQVKPTMVKTSQVGGFR